MRVRDLPSYERATVAGGGVYDLPWTDVPLQPDGVTGLHQLARNTIDGNRLHLPCQSARILDRVSFFFCRVTTINSISNSRSSTI